MRKLHKMIIWIIFVFVTLKGTNINNVHENVGLEIALLNNNV